MANSPYESGRMAHEYLLFHYGTAEQVLPWPEGPASALAFPRRCAAWVKRHAPADRRGRALDLGCAVGGAAFELAPAFDEVLGIDLSRTFIECADALRVAGQLQAVRREEGDLITPVMVQVPPELPRERVRFAAGDAARLPPDLGTFDAVLMANLLCRMEEPQALLRRLPELVRPGGIAVFTTPCTWLESFTPRERWMGGVPREDGASSTLDGLRRALAGSFSLVASGDEPFLIREHARKYQWSVAQVSVWHRQVDGFASPPPV